MQRLNRLIVAGLVALASSSCRTATRIVEVPRVDLELTGGNRGYLVGAPKVVSEGHKSTRAMVETEIEIPSLYKPTPQTAAPLRLEEMAPSEIDFPEGELPQAYETYEVKKGDTLWSIAADPSVFGDATKWRRLFNANRDALKSPDQIRPGMALRIPRGGSVKQEPSQQTTTFAK